MGRRKAYHHGDLRAAILSAARLALDEEGHEKLSILKISNALGVSPAAPYRHFVSKEALLQALVAETLDELEKRATVAAATPGSAKDKLRAACSAYLDFSEQAPGLFRLMMVSDDGIAHVSRIDGGKGRAYEIFEQLVAGTVPDASVEGARSAAALTWAQLFGYTVLNAAGRLRWVNTNLPRGMAIEAAVNLPEMMAPLLDK